MMVDHHNHHRPFSSTELASAATTAARGFATLHPFHTSYETAITAFKSPGDMMGFPFTNAQWKELQRQAMIYKYMMAAVPVPPHLLIPINSTTPYCSHPQPASFNFKFRNGADLEPGRCRRTDGKKWRCSRDAAPDQKYCERHMHRGRPRSRKPVEIDGNATKKTRPALPTSSSAVSNNASQPYVENAVFSDKTRCKVGDFDSSLDSRSLNLAMKIEAEPEQQWQTEIGLFSGRCVINQRKASNLGTFNAGEDEQTNHCSVFPDEQNSNTGSTIGLLSLGLNSIDEEMGGLGLGLIESNQNHNYCIKPTPGGPLAEVVQLSCVNAKAYQSSSSNSTAENGDSDQSPKGVLQKAIVSFSDSSGNSSPSLSSYARVKSEEIDMLWLNQQPKLQSSG